MPAWSRNVNGATKRNYKRLGTAYGKGTGLTLGLSAAARYSLTDEQWRSLAENVVAYQRDRLNDVSTQLELLPDLRELHPTRLMAPALVAFSAREGRSIA